MEAVVSGAVTAVRCSFFQCTMLVELLCLLVFALRLTHYAKVIPRDKFWKDPKNICIIVTLAVGGAYRRSVMGGGDEAATSGRTP